MTLGAYIRDVRIKAHYSPAQFAQMNHLSVSELLNMEQGRILPSKWFLLQMAGLFSLNECRLFTAHHTELIRKGSRQARPVSQRLELLKDHLEQWQDGKTVIHIFPVPEQLTGFVESITYYKTCRQPYTSEVVLPDGMPLLIIDLQKSSAFLIGQRDKPASLSLDRDVCKIIIRFQPDGLYHLTAIPQHTLLDAAVDAEQIFGRHIRLLCQQLTDHTPIDRLSDPILRFLTALLPDNNKHAAGSEVIRYMFRHIDERAATLTRLTGYSSKHLAHLFSVHVGLTPKLFQQVMKFKAAANELSLLPTHEISGYNWSGNYFDQPHFTRQFARFSGFTPAAYLRTGNTCPRMVLL